VYFSCKAMCVYMYVCNLHISRINLFIVEQLRILGQPRIQSSS